MKWRGGYNFLNVLTLFNKKNKIRDIFIKRNFYGRRFTLNIMRFFGFDDEDDYDDNEDYTEERRKKSGRSSRSSGGSNPAGKIIIYKYNKATVDTDKIHLRDEFNKGAMILVDLHELTQREYDEEGKDFIMLIGGMAFNRGGVRMFVEPSQYIFTPGPDMCEVWPEESTQE